MKVMSPSLLLVMLLVAGRTDAKTEPKTLVFQKDQAIDVLFLSTKPDTEAKLKDYFTTVFPLAKEAGYRPLPGFAITDSPTQGNYHPTTLVIASWKDRANRDAAMAKIESQVPDFHDRRREIWSSFAMTVYEAQQDISVTIHAERTYVLTAYWRKEGRSFGDFQENWRRLAQSAGGRIVLELEDGSSPFGYRYDPDYLVMTEWQDSATFETFYRQNLAMNHGSVDHVNQFILDAFPKK